jgi:hypothetical protein
MPNCTCYFCARGELTNLIVLFDTASAIGAIAAGIGLIIVAFLIVLAMTLYLIRERRGRPQSKRVSVATPVIDICSPAHSNVDRDSRLVVPQRPREVLLSCKTTAPCSPESLVSPLTSPFEARQPSPSIRVVSRYENTSQQAESYGPSGPANIDLDLEAQSWRPSKEKKNVKAERSYFPSPISPSAGLPISPPPSYSQIDRSLLVAVL